MNRLSMSKIGLAYRCSYGFRNDVQAPPRMVGRAARVGSAVHAIVESIVNKTPLDDTNASYGHIAEAWAYPPDISSTTVPSLSVMRTCPV